jgi:hypothetical protein
MTTSDDLGGVLLNGQNDGAMTDAPRYCVTRYEVWETAPSVPTITSLLGPNLGQCNTRDGAIDGFDLNGDYVVDGPEVGGGSPGYDHGTLSFADCHNTSITGDHKHVWRPSNAALTQQQADDFLSGLQTNGERPRDWRVLGGTFSLWTEISNVKLQN